MAVYQPTSRKYDTPQWASVVLQWTKKDTRTVLEHHVECGIKQLQHTNMNTDSTFVSAATYAATVLRTPTDTPSVSPTINILRQTQLLPTVTTTPPTQTPPRTLKKPSNLTTVYTDGSCTDNGKITARAGLATYWGPLHKWNCYYRLPGLQTNNRAELAAVALAIHQAIDNIKEIKRLEIKCDSQYVLNGITKWAPIWVENDWRNSAGKVVENKPLWHELLDLIRLFSDITHTDIIWTWVKAHHIDENNHAVDTLAKKGSLLPETNILPFSLIVHPTQYNHTHIQD